MIQLHCCIHRVSFDKDGEGTITLKVPLSDRRQVALLAERTEQVLFLTVDSKSQGGAE
jgi:hypothetical protein